MRWANFLHFYQPAEQQPDILEAVVVQSYRPLLEGIRANPRIKLTLNITGSLFELLDKYRYQPLIDLLRDLGREGRIEFTGSAKYHAFLPLTEPDEIVRQIKLNDETNRFFLGDTYEPRGFFPPEMAITPKVVDVVASLGFQWIILDEIACGGIPERVDYNSLYEVPDTNLTLFFRERRLSNLIMSAVVRSRESLLDVMREDLQSGRFVITAMDAETFGHHRPGLEKMLFDVFETPEIDFVKISDLPALYPQRKKIVPVPSTWASTQEDIERGAQFLSWLDPDNIIHKWQWAFLRLVLDAVHAIDRQYVKYDHVRHNMDIALSSDHFWWASAKPWWSLEMIEVGAFRLLETIRMVPNADPALLEQARDFYEKIITTAFTWQRTGKIREMMHEQKSIMRIPLKDRTLEKGGAEKGVYYALLDMLKRLEKEAAKREEYEQAILWRDAIYKFQNKLDIYDTINAIDLLRVKIPHSEVEKIIERYKDKYRRVRGGQPEQRGA